MKIQAVLWLSRYESRHINVWKCDEEMTSLSWNASFHLQNTPSPDIPEEGEGKRMEALVCICCVVFSVARRGGCMQPAIMRLVCDSSTLTQCQPESSSNLGHQFTFSLQLWWSWATVSYSTIIKNPAIIFSRKRLHLFHHLRSFYFHLPRKN